MTATRTPEVARAAPLDDYRILVIGGADRVEFLQGQLTQDVTGIDTGRSALAGWTTAKGRLLAVGQLIRTADQLLWPLPADIVDAVQLRLGMFRLRAQVDISVADDPVIGLFGLDPDATAHIGRLSLGAQPGATAADGDIIAVRHTVDPTRAWLTGPPHQVRAVCAAAGFAPGGRDEWRRLDISAGLPTVIAATAEAFIPQMLNLDLLGGISFTKGCYVGQEIVARTQNLGRIKRRMYRFRAEPGVDLSPGATIHGPERTTGKVVLTARADDAVELTAVVAIDQSGGNWYADAANASKLETLSLPYTVARIRSTT